MDRIEFFAPGQPKGQPRPRAFVRRFGNGAVSARVYDAGTAEGWKGCIALAVRPLLPPEPITGPVRLDVHFLFPRPKSLLRKKDPEGRIPHTTKPDRDNLDKAVMDALVNVGLLADDSLVCDGRIRKDYAAKGETSGAWIVVMPLFDETGELVDCAGAGEDVTLFGDGSAPR